MALGWWAPDPERAGEQRAGKLKLFDGQHKAAAQILLGVRELPVRVFVEPDSIYEVSDYLGCGSYGSRVVPEVECTS